MKRVTVLQIEDSNMAGFIWTWELWVGKRKEGTFTVGARQKNFDEPNFSPPSITRLRNGYSVLQAIRSIMVYGDVELSPDLLEGIAIKLKSLDPELTTDFEYAVANEDDIEAELILIEKENKDRKLEPYRKLIDDYVLQFSDAPGRLGYSSMTRRNMVRGFIEHYVVENGFLPTGIHSVKRNSGGSSYSSGSHDFSDLGRWWT